MFDSAESSDESLIQAVEESFSVASIDSDADDKLLEALFSSFTIGNLITVPVHRVNDPIATPVIEVLAKSTLGGWWRAQEYFDLSTIAENSYSVSFFLAPQNAIVSDVVRKVFLHDQLARHDGCVYSGVL